MPDDYDYAADSYADEIRELKDALRSLWEVLAVDGTPRIVAIPNLDKFWRAYDAAGRLL